MLTVALTVILAAEPVIDIDAELAIETVAPRTHVVVEKPPFAGNSLLAEMPDGTLLFAGSPYDPATTRRLLAYARKRFGTRPLVAIDSHFHLDGGSGGNAAFAEAGAKVYGSSLTAKLVRERARSLQTAMAREDKARFEAFLPSPPATTFPLDQGLTLHFGAEEVQVRFPGPAHSPDNVVVWLPARAVLFGGCAVVSMPKMGFLGDADLVAWPAALDFMARLKPRIVIPGHSRIGDASLLDHTRELVETSRKEKAR